MDPNTRTPLAISCPASPPALTRRRSHLGGKAVTTDPATRRTERRSLPLRRAAAILGLVAGLAAVAAPGARADDKSTPPPSQPPPDAARPPEAHTTAPTIILNKNNIQGILGRNVIGAKGEDMGRIVDVIVDRSGQARAAVIDFGGFLGVGARKIAVDWNALHFAPGGQSGAVKLFLTREQLAAAPEYQEGKSAVVVSATGTTEPIPPEDVPWKPE